MKLIKQLLGVVALLMAFSCSTDSMGDDDALRPADGTPLSLPMKLCIGNATEVQTRATELITDKILILLFDESDRCILSKKMDAPLANGAAINVEGINATTNKRTLIVIANYEKILTGFDPLGKTLQEVKNGLVDSYPLFDSGIKTFMSTEPRAIFSATLLFDKGISWKSAISSTGTIYGDPLALIRHVAQVSIRGPHNADSGIQSATLCNIVNKSYVLQRGEIPFATEYVHYCEDGLVGGGTLTNATQFRKVVDNPSDLTRGTIGPIVALESDEVSVLLAVKHAKDKPITYYRIAICDELKKSIPLVLNTHYIVNITSISGPGYRLADEAIANIPTNQIKYTVEIEGGGHVVTNGEHYLAFSSAQFLLCQQNGTCQNFNFGTLTYYGPSTVADGELVFDCSDEFWGSTTNTVLSRIDKVVTETPLRISTAVITKANGIATFTARYGMLEASTTLRRVSGNLNIIGDGMGHYGFTYDLGVGYSQIAFDEECAWARLTYESNPSSLESLPRLEGTVDPTKRIYLVANYNTKKDRREIRFSATMKANNLPVKGACVEYY